MGEQRTRGLGSILSWSSPLAPPQLQRSGTAWLPPPRHFLQNKLPLLYQHQETGLPAPTHHPRPAAPAAASPLHHILLSRWRRPCSSPSSHSGESGEGPGMISTLPFRVAASPSISTPPHPWEVEGTRRGGHCCSNNHTVDKQCGSARALLASAPSPSSQGVPISLGTGVPPPPATCVVRPCPLWPSLAPQQRTDL